LEIHIEIVRGPSLSSRQQTTTNQAYILEQQYNSGREARPGARPSEEAKEHGHAEHEEPDDVEEQQRLPGDGRRDGSDLAEPALRDAGPRARCVLAAAPVRDTVSAANRVRAEAPHRARRGARHGNRAGVAGLGGGRGGAYGLGEEQRERREEEAAVEADARGRGGARHGAVAAGACGDQVAAAVAMVVGIAGSVESDGGRLEKFFPLATGWPGASFSVRENTVVDFGLIFFFLHGFWFNKKN
jgi:hypothetical protein